MRVAELLLYGVAGWCGIGAAGIAVSLTRGRRAEALKHAASLAAVAGIYLLVVLAVSELQRQKIVPIGRDQCYDGMCFAVVEVDEVPGLVVGDDGRVVRVAIRVTNRGRSAEAEEAIAVHLLDSKGREWEPLAGFVRKQARWTGCGRVADAEPADVSCGEGFNRAWAGLHAWELAAATAGDWGLG